MSSPSIDKPGILTPNFFVVYPVPSSVLCNNYFRFRSIPFRFGFYTFPSKVFLALWS